MLDHDPGVLAWRERGSGYEVVLCMVGGYAMAEVVSYEGEFGLMAILQALDNVRQILLAEEVEPEQAAGYLGCINLHLAQIVGLRGEFREHLHECAGLLCPQCKAYVGFVSNLSGVCYHCGGKLFPSVFEQAAPGSSQATE